MKMMTLEELANKIPIYMPDGTQPDFSFKTWRFAEEKLIGELKKKHKNLGRFVREIFFLMLNSFGGREWASIPENERKILLNQLPLGSVMYMYIYLRYEALGEDLKMSGISCPSCASSIDEFTFKLKRPFVVGDVKVIELKFQFTPWDAMEKLAPNLVSNEGAIKEVLLKYSLAGAVAEDIGPVKLDKFKILENLSKKDIEGAYEKLDEHNGGPVMGLEVDCPSCAHKWNTPLSWDYNFFFSNSSLSMKK
jgi:hypothetical protein